VRFQEVLKPSESFEAISFVRKSRLTALSRSTLLLRSTMYLYLFDTSLLISVSSSVCLSSPSRTRPPIQLLHSRLTSHSYRFSPCSQSSPLPNWCTRSIYKDRSRFPPSGYTSTEIVESRPRSLGPPLRPF